MTSTGPVGGCGTPHTFLLLLPWPGGQRTWALSGWGDRPANTSGKKQLLCELQSVTRTRFSLKPRGVQEN